LVLVSVCQQKATPRHLANLAVADLDRDQLRGIVTEEARRARRGHPAITTLQDLSNAQARIVRKDIERLLHLDGFILIVHAPLEQLYSHPPASFA
jgi:hypothetical protein